MTDFINGYIWATALAPVEAYVLYRFGGVLIQDVKVLAYYAWNKVNGK